MKPKTKSVIDDLKKMSDPENLKVQAHFGIDTRNSIGITTPKLRLYAKKLKKDHELALDLWETNLHEAQILAGFIDDYKQVTEQQLENWVADFDSWDVCDSSIGNLFDKTPFAIEKAIEWTYRKEEYVKRAGFVMMAGLAVHAKKMDDKDFLQFFPHILREAHDERNFVRKAINWAIRQMGKRSRMLNEKAIELSLEVQLIDSKAALWIAQDALRELRDEKVIARLKR